LVLTFCTVGLACWSRLLAGLCLGPYSEHSEKTGGFYACNKFEERVKTEGRTEEERLALGAARALKCYEMAYERNLNHRGALEAAQGSLFKQVPPSAPDPTPIPDCSPHLEHTLAPSFVVAAA
jgi:hypothetical protein